MLKKEIKNILDRSRQWGWVLEPDAQRIFSLYGFRIPRYDVVSDPQKAVAVARKIGYPVVAKIVSPAIVHKSDVQGVVVGIKDDRTLLETLERLKQLNGFSGMLIGEMVKGLELIIGAKNDFQFGPVILLGMGGVGVEIYKDVALRMAPLDMCDTENMIRSLTARKLLAGYRGSEAVNEDALKKTLLKFSRLMMDLQDLVESIDLNPVMCTAKACTIVDSRIMLNGSS